SLAFAPSGTPTAEPSGGHSGQPSLSPIVETWCLRILYIIGIPLDFTGNAGYFFTEPFGWNEVKLPLCSLTARNVPKSGNPLLVVCEGVARDARAELVEGLNVRLLALSVRLALHLRVGVRGIPSWNDMAIACRRSRHNRGAEQGQDESDAGKHGYLLW